jgi:exosortase E/protease (VPEID-CTERM system)
LATEFSLPLEVSAEKRLPLTRWGCLVGLLVAELVFFSVQFDTGTLMASDAWWAWVILRIPQLLRVGIVALAAMGLFHGAALAKIIRSGYPDHASSRWFPWVIMHVGVLIGFYLLTEPVLEGGLDPTLPVGWVLAWAVLGIAVLACIALAFFPARLWVILVRRGWPGLVGGATAGLAAWWAGHLVTNLWEPLSEGTLWVVHQLLTLVYSSTVYDPENLQVGTETFSVIVAAECSGYEGIGLLWVFLAGYCWLFRHRLRFPHVLLLFPVGTAVIWLFNALRIALLITIGDWGWENVARGGFHSQAGWLAFIAVALGLSAAAGRWEIFQGSRSNTCAEPGGNPAAPYLMPFLVAMGAGMVAAAFSGTFNQWAPLRLLAVTPVLWWFRRTYAEFSWVPSWQAVAVGAATAAAWLLLVPADPASAAKVIAGLDSLPKAGAALWLILQTIGYVVMVPMVEELAFRGYLTRRLQARDFRLVPLSQFTWPSFLISSAAFGALHGPCWLPACLAGILFALVLYHRGSLVDAIVAHATTNGLIATYVFCTGQWSLWS